MRGLVLFHQSPCARAAARSAATHEPAVACAADMSSHLTCIAAPSDSTHVQDFVKLAKWEDRGYYAQQQATEKAQRQLLKLVTRSEAVLAMPAGPILAAAAAAASQPQEPASNGAKESHKAGAHPAPLTLDADEVGLACTWHPAVFAV